MDKAIFRNFAINFTGLILPTFVSLVTVPTYIRLLGLERYGIIALVGVYIAYFAMLDLGMGIATENRISRAHLSNNELPIDRVFWSAIWTNLCTGIAGAALIYGAALLYVHHITSLPPALQGELHDSLPWLALCIPVANLSAVFVASISGAQRFGILNTSQTVGTFVEQLLPIAVVLLTRPSLPAVLATITLVRLCTLVALGVAAVRVLHIKRVLGPRLSTIRNLFGYGGWIMLTTVIATIMETLDTVILGMVMGARYVTYYSVPQNLVSRLSLLPLSLTRTLFPRLVACERAHADEIVQNSLSFLTALFTPIGIVAIFALGPFLDVWIGHDLSAVSSPAGRALVLAAWIVGQSNVLRVLVQAQANAATLVRLGLIEVPFFVGCLWIAISSFGLLGACVTVVIRGFVDYGILIFLSRVGAKRVVPDMLSQLVFLVLSLVLANAVGSLALLAATGLLMLAANAGFSLYKSSTLRDLVLGVLMKLSLKRSA